VTVIRLAADRVFFEEWSRLRGQSKRSIPRAAALAEALRVNLRDLPSIVVVGSKGKASAAITASAALAAAGHRVGTITSPPILTNRERIRVNGVAIDERTYDEIAERVERALEALPPPLDGYLSPAGAYMVAGIDHFHRAGCDTIVVEAGMGGRSDEVSLLDPHVLAVTPIFEEHLGILGDTLEEIVNEKLGAAGPGTKIVRTTERNKNIGLDAARALDPHATLDGVSIHLPGRMTWHVDGEGRLWRVDAAIDATGIAGAVPRDIDFVLVSLPDGKDIARTAALLDAQFPDRWLPVRPQAAEHLTYRSWNRDVPVWEASLVEGQSSVAAAGSWSFIAEVLAHLGVDNERAFSIAPEDA
jgi:dihydrofolate synthase/folylpolyglutamate synthase